MCIENYKKIMDHLERNSKNKENNKQPDKSKFDRNHAGLGRSKTFQPGDKLKRKLVLPRSKMDKNTRRHFTTLLDTNPHKFLQELSTAIKNSHNQKVSELLSIMEAKPQNLLCVKHYREGEDESETLLHIAVKYEDEKPIIERIINICPDLLSLARETSDNYRGQTPLHIAITKGNENVTDLLLSSAVMDNEYNKKQATNRTKLTMINTPATGHLFANTVMMGELPLSVAALTFNTNIVEFLLDHGATIHAQNTSGDTVLHSLVKYCAIYPNKTENVLAMFEFFIDRMREENSHYDLDMEISLKEDSYVWFIKNYENFTALQLSARLGVVELFQFIIKLENVYSFVSTHDGLFDVKLYDITEIDTVANQHISSGVASNEGQGSKKISRNIDGVSRASIKVKTECLPFRCGQFEYPETESILEMMFDYDYTNSCAFRIIESIPVKNIILEKWQKLRYFYFGWGLIHLFMTICLTATIVIRSDMYANSTVLDRQVTSASMDFANVISWTSFIVGGIIYLLLVILLLTAKKRRSNALRYVLHNLGYVIFILVFSICLFVDFFMTRTSKVHDNIALIIAVIAGWWFSIFFLRAIRLFSFFTEMIRRVIIGDLLRFAVIISFMLFAFTGGMYAVFVGKNDQQSTSYIDAIEQNFNSYGGAMMTMFKLMLGLGDIEVLNEARLPGFAIALYVIFALLTYVLLINSLIAMMSQTCAIVLEDRYPQWRLQQLSVILFMEDLFCFCCMRHTFKSPGTKKEIRAFDPVTKQTKVYSRYFLKIHSLQTTYASEEDREAMKKTVIEKQQSKMEGSLRSDIGTFNYRVSTRYLPSIRRRPTPSFRLPEVEMPAKSSVTDDNIKRKRSSRRNKQLSRVVEEETILKQNAIKLGSEPDLIRSEKSPKSRRRYHSENMHEKENRKTPPSMASVSSENINSEGLLTPVDLKLNVHRHHSDCPERGELFMPNGCSHVDIEPYPNSSC